MQAVQNLLALIQLTFLSRRQTFFFALSSFFFDPTSRQFEGLENLSYLSNFSRLTTAPPCRQCTPHHQTRTMWHTDTCATTSNVSCRAASIICLAEVSDVSTGEQFKDTRNVNVGSCNKTW